MQSDENETKDGGMILIPKSIGNNGHGMCNNGTDEIIIAPTLSRSSLEKLYNRLSHDTDSPIGSAKRGPFTALAFKADFLFLVN